MGSQGKARPHSVPGKAENPADGGIIARNTYFTRCLAVHIIVHQDCQGVNPFQLTRSAGRLLFAQTCCNYVHFHTIVYYINIIIDIDIYYTLFCISF